MTLHIGTNPFSNADPANYLWLPPNDQIRLAYLGGGVPFAAICWGQWGTTGADSVRSWRWLHDHGYTRGLCRVYLPQGELIDPIKAVDDTVEPYQDAERGLVDVVCQWGNEYNNEYWKNEDGSVRNSPSTVRDWALACLARWRDRLPAKRFYAPAPAQDNDFAAWVQALDPLYRVADGIAPHYYFGRKLGDQEPGYEGSPEWWRERYPDKPLWISESANWTEHDNVRYVYSRWLGLPYVEGYADWKMSGPNDAEFNWTDDHANVMYEVCKEWRQARAFPATSALPPPAPADVDLAALTGVMHRVWASRDLLINERGRHSAVESIVIDDLFREIVDYKQLLGI